MTLWWERYPERLDAEIQALSAAGFRHEPVESSVRQGTYQLKIWRTVNGEECEFLVTFPENYPFFRFEIAAPTLALAHHQNPLTKTLCFIGRETYYWRTCDTVAAFLADRLPQVLLAGTTGDPRVARPLEQPRAEPFSDYYPYAYAICHVDSSWVIPPVVQRGGLTFGFIDYCVPKVGGVPWLQAVVISVTEQGGRELAVASTELRTKFRPEAVFQGRWVRTDTPLATDVAETAFKLAQQLDGTTQLPWATIRGHRMQVYAVLFPEETRPRAMGEGWVFFVRIQKLTAAHPKGASRGRKSKDSPVPPSYYFARAGRVGVSDMVARAPELAPLRAHRIAQVGLGALGAPSALEFARAGIGELHLMDNDHVDPAASVRWPFGLPTAGRPKVEAIGTFISLHYPYTAVTLSGWRIGALNAQGGSEELEINNWIAGVSLIYDATAEFGVQHFLSELSRDRKLCYMSVVATPGAWGGRVLRIRPGRTEGCWSCLQHAEDDGTIPRAPADEHGETQPVGCGDPTFTGASFDLSTVALEGVRLAVSTLCDGARGGYPAVDWDVAVVNLRDDRGLVIPPHVDVYPLRRHPSCLACAQRDAR